MLSCERANQICVTMAFLGTFVIEISFGFFMCSFCNSLRFLPFRYIPDSICDSCVVMEGFSSKWLLQVLMEPTLKLV